MKRLILIIGLTLVSNLLLANVLESIHIEAYRAPYRSKTYLKKEDVKLPLTFTVEYIRDKFGEPIPKKDKLKVVIEMYKIGPEYYVKAKYIRNGELRRIQRRKRLKRFTNGFVRTNYTYKFHAAPYGWLNEKLVIKGIR